MQNYSTFGQLKSKLAITQTFAIGIEEERYHVAYVCGHWMKTPNFFLKIGIFFRNWRKSHLISIGNGANFRPLITQKKPGISPSSSGYPCDFVGILNSKMIFWTSSYCANTMDPDPGVSLGSFKNSLVRVHSVCFYMINVVWSGPGSNMQALDQPSDTYLQADTLPTSLRGR